MYNLNYLIYINCIIRQIEGEEKKKRKQDSTDKIKDDGWIVKKKTKRSTTEAEDIRRHFRTEDKH